MGNREPEPVGGFTAEGTWTKTVWIPQIDDESFNRVDKVKRELDIEAVAAAEGHQNLPAPTDATLNSKQMEICNRVFAGILMLNEFLAQQIGIALRNARALMPPSFDVELIFQKIDGAIDGIVREHEADLRKARRGNLDAELELNYFRYQNGLLRRAVHDKPVVMAVAIILAMLLGESTLNGALFSEVMTAGLVEGVLFAAAVSVLNIGSGLLAGFFGWRYIGHRKPRARVLGFVVAITLHVLAVCGNILVAHFREVAEQLAANASFNFDPSALTTALSAHIATHGYLGITSLQAWALLLFGLFIHFYAAKEGWDDLSDRYPDYKKTYLHFIHSEEDYEDERRRLREAGREAIQEVENEFRNTISMARNCYEATSHLLEVALERQGEVRNSEDRWVADGNQLLLFYRETNLKIRNRKTEPAYFRSYPSAEDYRERNFGSGLPPSDEIGKQTKLIQRGIEDIQSLRDKAKKSLDDAEAAMRGVQKRVRLAIQNLDKRIEEECTNIDSILEEERRRAEQQGGEPNVVHIRTKVGAAASDPANEAA